MSLNDAGTGAATMGGSAVDGNMSHDSSQNMGFGGGAFGSMMASSPILGGYIGADNKSKAQQKIAEDQAAQQAAERQTAMGYAAPTSYELSSLQDALSNYQRTFGLQTAQLEHEQNMQSALDPQIQSLLNGGSAPTMKPYMDFMNMQKNSLQSDLSRQMGPGWEQTTAGQNALQGFNINASQQASQLQQQYMGSMFANSLGLGSMISGGINQNAATLNNLGSGAFGMSGDLQKRQISASEGTSLVPYSGADQLGQLAQGTYQMQQSAANTQAITSLAKMAATG